MPFYRIASCITLLLASINLGASAVALDTLVPAAIQYQGYRLHIRKVKVLKQKDKSYLLNFEAVNTGRRPISMGPGFPRRFLQTNFDRSLSSQGLLPLALPIREAIIDSRINFEVSQWEKNLEFWVSSDDPIEVRKLQIDDFEKRQEIIKRKAQGDSTQVLAKADGTMQSPTDQNCIDIELSSVDKIFSDKNTATLQLTLTNNSNRSVLITDLPEALGISLFLTGSPQLTGSARKLATLDLKARLEKRAEKAIAAGEKIVFVQRIDTKTATRYTGVIIAQFDAAQALFECDETNNQNHALLYD